MKHPLPLSENLTRVLNHKILTREEEAKLGRIINGGRKTKRKMVRGRRERIITLSAAAKRAGQTIVLHNLRLVLKVVWQHQHRTMLTPDDLFQLGVEGCLKAVRKWDYRRARFTTYAHWWIVQVIKRAIEEGSHLVAIKGRAMTLICMEPEKARKLPGVSAATLKAVEAIRRGEQREVSMTGLKFDCPQTEQGSGITTVERREVMERFERALLVLKPRDQVIVRLRLVEEYNLDKVGEVFNLSRERIRQIVKEAVQVIRERMGRLSDYV